MKTRIGEARQRCGYTQEQLAEMLNLSQRSVSSYESGYREPSLETIIFISKLCNVSVNYLLGLDEEKLSDTEEKLLNRFRQLDDEGQEIVLTEALRQKQRMAASPTTTKAAI